jgi:hypothetical protein
MQQESATASELGDDVDFDVTLRETLVRMVSKELQNQRHLNGRRNYNPHSRARHPAV